MNKVWIVLLFIGLLIGCSNASLEPAAIDVNVESCAACNMGINDVTHATQVIFSDGKSDVYDDIGCMIAAFKENEDNIGTGYVHDYLTEEWIDMNEATYVQDANIMTPMNYGIIAFHSSDEAINFQSENGGDIYSIDELKQMDMQHVKHADEHHDESGDHHE